MLSIDEEINWCKADIETMQKRIAMLEEKKKESLIIVPKHGDIVVIDKLFKRIVIKDKEGFQAYDSYGLKQAGTELICGSTVEKMYNNTGSSRYIVVGNVFGKSFS